MAPPVDLSGLQTESRNSRTRNIDTVSALELCQILHREDSTIPTAVEPCLPVIAEAINTLAGRVQRGGRVFYIGAGTSGRLGVLDASEILPTYSAPAGQFVALIAGGDYALRNAIEGAEDDVAQAQKDLGEFNIDPGVDSLIGIASSGRTPYVLGGLAWAKSIGCTTVGVACAHPSAIGDEGNADFVISAVTGPESVTGSTRMKAGTATKLVLNMISTGIMIRTGKTYGNLMVDLKASNLKLKQRARNILRAIDRKAVALTNDELDAVLEACGGSTKLAAVSIVLGVSAEDAEARLKSSGGILAKVFEEYHCSETKSNIDEGLALCVDAGGTSCTAVILSKDEAIGRGVAGPCNISSNGIDAAVGSISSAVQAAVDDCEVTKGRAFPSIRFADAWIGIAGYDRPSLVTATTEAINNMFRLQSGKKPTITTDIDLLPAKLNTNAKIESAIVLVAGTGSIVMQYQRQDSRFVRTGRLGGWGHLLGDDGSGYGIGREGLRRALRQIDAVNLSLDSEDVPTYSALTSAIVNHFQAKFPNSNSRDLLSTVLAPEQTAQNSGDATADKTSRIAGTAKIILDLAETDDEAREIVHNGAQQLADLVTLLVQTRKVAVVKTGLILSGGLMHNDVYRQRVTTLIESTIGSFGHVEIIDNPAEDAAKALLLN